MPRRPFRFSDIPWRKVVPGVILAGAIVWMAWRWIDFPALHERIARCNAPALIALLVFLPLIGFPVRLLHVAAGVRFGVGPGLAIVSLSILVQLVASHFMARHWGERISRMRWVKRVRERVPSGAHRSASVVALLLPGAPYMAVNLVLPLIGVPLRTFLLVAWPIHSIRSTLSVAFGDQSNQLTPGRVAALLGYALLMIAASWWTYRRMQAQSPAGSPPPAADGRKRRG